MIGTKQKEDKCFELVLLVKDNNGNPTGQKKTIQSDHGSALAKFWERNNGKNKKSKKYKNAAAATNKRDIEVGLKEVESYTEKIRKQRRLEE